jgi:hypothetical protein
MQRCILFAIDVEPDGRAEVRNDPWTGTAVTLRALIALRSDLEEMCRSPVRFNWFFRFDPQIEQTWGRSDWVLEACPRLIQWVLENRDFTGIHVHFWRCERHHRRWFSDFADSNWTAQCLRTAIAGYHSVFGARPVACRLGDRWMGNGEIKLLQAEGIRYDLTVEPGVAGGPQRAIRMPLRGPPITGEPRAYPTVRRLRISLFQRHARARTNRILRFG